MNNNPLTTFKIALTDNPDKLTPEPLVVRGRLLFSESSWLERMQIVETDENYVGILQYCKRRSNDPCPAFDDFQPDFQVADIIPKAKLRRWLMNFIVWSTKHAVNRITMQCAFINMAVACNARNEYRDMASRAIEHLRVGVHLVENKPPLDDVKCLFGNDSDPELVLFEQGCCFKVGEKILLRRTNRPYDGKWEKAVLRSIDPIRVEPCRRKGVPERQL